MDLSHIKLFRDIARERSLTKGAHLNKISQSAASQHIQELERRFEIRLLDRSTRPLTLTAAGNLYLDFCRDVLRRQVEFNAGLDRLKGHVEGTVRVSSIYSIGLSEMTRLEQEFRNRYPGAELAVEYLRPDRVYEAVASDAADIGLVSYPEPARDLKVIPWRREVMLVVTKPDHPLAVNTFLSPRQLDGESFIGFDEDLPIMRDIGRYLRGHGVRVEVSMRFDNVLMIKEAVALGSGISILPERSILEEIAQERLIGIPLESPGLFRPLGIIHRRRKRFHRATAAFLELLERQPQEAPPVPAG